MDVATNDPVIASTPTPLSIEPRSAPAGEAAEVSRQEAEATAAANSRKSAEPAKEAAKEEKVAPRSIKDAIRAAEKKVNAEPVVEKATPLKADPKVAEAAPTAKGAEHAAKAAEPTKDAPAAVTRGDDGKFVSTKAAEPVAPALAEAKAAEPAKPAALPAHTANPPPARFSAAAKEKWAEAPEEVRAETERAVSELTKGFEKHRAAAERDAGLVEFHDMAGKSGKALKDVVAQYVGMEQLLRTDLVGGLELIAKNAGFSLRDVAAKIMGQTPDAAASAQDATIRDLNAKIARLEQGLGTLTTEREQTRTLSTTEAVTKFASENPRFEELSDDIAFFLKTRTKDLSEAYKLAERLNPAPATQAQPVTEPVVASSATLKLVPPSTPPSSSDAGTKSIAGTPTAGSDPVSKVRSSTIKEAIRRATAAAG